MEEDTEILGDFLAFFRLSEIMENVQNRRLTSILSLVSDLLIAGLVLVSIVWLFNGRAGVLRATDASAFKIFTVQSNVFLGLICLILVPFDILMIVEKVEKLPKWALILLHAGEMSTNITMLTVVFFLGPTMGYGFMYVDANLLMHLVTPLLGLVRFLLLSKDAEKVDWRLSFLAAIPMLLYTVYYLIGVIANNGYGNPDYDWYGFGAAGPMGAIVSGIVMVLFDIAGSAGFFFARGGIVKLLEKE